MCVCMYSTCDFNGQFEKYNHEEKDPTRILLFVVSAIEDLSPPLLDSPSVENRSYGWCAPKSLVCPESRQECIDPCLKQSCRVATYSRCPHCTGGVRIIGVRNSPLELPKGSVYYHPLSSNTGASSSKTLPGPTTLPSGSVLSPLEDVRRFQATPTALVRQSWWLASGLGCSPCVRACVGTELHRAFERATIIGRQRGKCCRSFVLFSDV